MLQRFVDLAEAIAEHGFEQRHLRPRASQRDDGHDVLGRSGQPRRPGEYDVANRGRHLDRAGRQRLGDEERIAASDSMQPLDVRSHCIGMRSGVVVG